MVTKTCTKCGEAKELAEFSPQIKGLFGRTARCKACARLYNRAKQSDPAYVEAQRQRSRKWHSANRDRRREYDRARMSDPEIQSRRRVSSRQWAQAHPERPRAYASKRRALKAASVVEPFKPTDVYGSWEGADLWGCFFCGGELTAKSLEVDHFYPLSERVTWRGPHAVWNLVPSHQWCNGSKKDREPWTFLRASLAQRGIDLDACLAMFDDEGHLIRN